MDIQDYYKYSQFASMAYVNWEQGALLGNYETAIANADAANRIPGRIKGVGDK
jgi:hypothetical protein